MTAEEFATLPYHPSLEELVRGRVVRRPLCGLRRGEVWSNLVVLLLPLRQLGFRIVGRVGVVLSRGPDTVRGPDAACYRANVPPVSGYPTVLPVAVFEILDPWDDWTEILDKVADYAAAGVAAVGIDPDSSEVCVFEPGRAERRFGVNDAIDLPILPGFAVSVAVLFS